MEIELKDIKLENPTSAPIPGCFFIEMIPNINTNSHSNALDKDFRMIHMPISEMFPIDVLAEMKTIEKEKKETWLRPGTQIDSLYYQEKIDRNELLMRDEQKHSFEDVLEYQTYLHDTFEMVQEYNKDIVEEYPLLLGDKDYVLMSGDIKDIGDFKLEKGETSLIYKCVTIEPATDKSITYDSTKLHVEDEICIEIKNDKTIYSEIKHVYRLFNEKY